MTYILTREHLKERLKDLRAQRFPSKRKSAQRDKTTKESKNERKKGK